MPLPPQFFLYSNIFFVANGYQNVNGRACLPRPAPVWRAAEYGRLFAGAGNVSRSPVLFQDRAIVENLLQSRFFTGLQAAVEAPRGRIERAFVLMPIRGYSPHRLPQGQARQAAPWTRPLTLSPRRLSKRCALPQACGLPAFRRTLPPDIGGTSRHAAARLNQRFRRDYAAAGYPGATGFLKKSPLSELSSESGLRFITSGGYHHPLKRLRTSLHSSAPPAAVSSSANQSRGFAPSPVSGTAAFSEAPQTVQTPS